MTLIFNMINTKNTTPVEIDGVVFNLKTVTNGEKLTLNQMIIGFEKTARGFDALMHLLGDFISTIDGQDEQIKEAGSVNEFMVGLDNFITQRTIMNAIVKHNELDIDTEKN